MALRDGAYLLPTGEEREPALRELAEECLREGGSAWLMYVQPQSAEEAAAYRQLFDQAAEAILIGEVDGTWVMANDAACALFGYAREEILGQRAGFSSPEIQPDGRPSREVLDDFARMGREGRSGGFEFTSYRKDGSLVHTELSVAPLRKDGRTMVQVVLRDRTGARRAAQEKEALERQLFEAADAVESGLAGFGDHQMTLSVYAESLKALEEKLARIRGIAHQSGFRLEREVFGLAATFFAIHPGNMDYRMRAMTVASTNFADLASLHAAEAGTTSERLAWDTPVTVFETLQGSQHRFSFHEPGNPAEEPTIGHTLVLGRSGGGKSTTVAFLVAQAQRAGVRTILFDKEAGLKMVVHALGGRYAEVRAGRATGLNPLASETGPRGEAWLLDWLSALLESGGARLTPHQSEELKRAIRQNASVPADLRNFRDFRTLIGDVGDGRDLAMRVGEWGPDGRYSWVFGPAEVPVVDFGAQDITAVDLTEILDLATERTAVLAYLFRRIEMLIEEKRPTLIVIDEAWKVLDDDYFSRKLSEWLVTARKKNVVVLMMTQFPSQIRSSRSRAILEALPNQLMFPNPEADGAEYDSFRMTEGELGFVLAGTLGRRSVLWRTSRGSSVLDVDLSSLGPLLTVLGGGRAGQAAFGDDYAERSNFWKRNHT